MPAVPSHQRGVSRSSRTRGGMRWTLTALLTRAPDSGRKRRVVLAPRRWCQVRGRRLSRVTVAKEPEHRGEHAIIRKTIVWGMPGVTGVTCMLVCAFYSILHTRPWGASSARHSLRPFRGEATEIRQTSRKRMRRECEGAPCRQPFEIRIRSPDERSEIRGRCVVHSRMSLRSSGLQAVITRASG